MYLHSVSEIWNYDNFVILNAKWILVEAIPKPIQYTKPYMALDMLMIIGSHIKLDIIGRKLVHINHFCIEMKLGILCLLQQAIVVDSINFLVPHGARLFAKQHHNSP